eukprot:scaffold261301_cov34-Tisochrysis_lutea.AAC.3
MERAPPPSPAAAAIDEVLMDTPLSPKRLRRGRPAQPGGPKSHHATPRNTANSEQRARSLYDVCWQLPCCHAAAQPQHPPQPQPQPLSHFRTPHLTPYQRWTLQ